MPRKQNTLKEGFWEAFPTRLRKLFKDTGHTQQELADYLGLKSRQTITAYVDGTSSPPWQTITKIAHFFDVPSDYLLGLSDVKRHDTDLQAVCEYTGLSGEAVERLHEPDTSPLHPLINLMLSDDFAEYTGGVCEAFLRAKSSHDSYLKAEEAEFNEGIDVPPAMLTHENGTVTISADLAYSLYLNIAADRIKGLLEDAISGY